MKKEEAIEKADEYTAETGKIAHVLFLYGTYEFFSDDYFSSGHGEGQIVYTTSWE